MKLLLLKIYKRLPAKIRFLISYLIADKFIVGMIAFVVKDKKILFVKHSYQNKWGLPGGWMKRGENLESVMEREIIEEVGIKVKVVDVLEINSIKTRPVVDVVVKCEVVSGKIKEDQIEVENAAFFSIDDIPNDIISTQKSYIKRFIDSIK